LFCKDSSLGERPRGTRRWCGLKLRHAARLMRGKIFQNRPARNAVAALLTSFVDMAQ